MYLVRIIPKIIITLFVHNYNIDKYYEIINNTLKLRYRKKLKN